MPWYRGSWKEILLLTTTVVILTLLLTSQKYEIHDYLRGTWLDPDNYLKVNVDENTMKILNEAKVAQDDPRLIKVIKDQYIEAPSKLPYNLENWDMQDYSKLGMSPEADDHLNKNNGGFFIECGGFDGETGSNSLFFEKTRGWSGLLIEADPVFYTKLKSKNRKAFTANVCLSTVPYPASMVFSQDDTTDLQKGRLADTPIQQLWISGRRDHVREINVQCFPLYSLLLALNQTKVDYFSLDIEGDELAVLKTIPFEKIDITVIGVEYLHHIDKGVGMFSFLKSKGYEEIQRFGRGDIMFKKIK